MCSFFEYFEAHPSISYQKLCFGHPTPLFLMGIEKSLGLVDFVVLVGCSVTQSLPLDDYETVWHQRSPLCQVHNWIIMVFFFLCRCWKARSVSFLLMGFHQKIATLTQCMNLQSSDLASHDQIYMRDYNLFGQTLKSLW